MNKKFLLSVLALFVVSMIADFIIHGLLLKPYYATLSAVYRSEQESAPFFPYMLLAHVFIAAGFVWLYLRGKQNAPFLMQGVRFGVAVAVLTTIPGYLIYYAVQPLPPMLVVEQIVFSCIAVVLMGIVVAALNRK
jgi:hypothetical protein